MADEFVTLMIQMNAGFDKVFDKVDKLKDEFADHKVPCAEKFADIDKKLSMKEAVNCEREGQEKEKRDWGKWYIRLILGALTLAVIANLWK